MLVFISGGVGPVCPRLSCGGASPGSSANGSAPQDTLRAARGGTAAGESRDRGGVAEGPWEGVAAERTDAEEEPSLSPAS